jgi:cytoskeletal protein CcmA (bactofilin family)
MVVGRDVHLTGKVSACDQLTVDGIVEITLTDARLLRIGQSGHFKGHVDVAEAEIAGHFEGDLTVREKLTVLSTAHITGIIRYGHIVVEAGGHLAGEISGLNEDKADAPGGDQPRGVEQKPVVNVDPRAAAAGRPAIPPRQQIPGQQAPLVPKP